MDDNGNDGNDYDRLCGDADNGDDDYDGDDFDGDEKKEYDDDNHDDNYFDVNDAEDDDDDDDDKNDNNGNDCLNLLPEKGDTSGKVTHSNNVLVSRSLSLRSKMVMIRMNMMIKDG